MTELEQTLIFLSSKEKEFDRKYEADLMEARRNLNKNIISIETSALAIKNDFVAFIKNKSIPLDERWDIFKKSPNILKEKNFDIVSTGSEGIDYIIDMININEEPSYEEFLFFDSVNFINRYFYPEEIAEIKEAKKNNELLESDEIELLEFYDDAVEAILQSNCSSIFLK